jgi:hypothetical protein
LTRRLEALKVFLECRDETTNEIEMKYYKLLKDFTLLKKQAQIIEENERDVEEDEETDDEGDLEESTVDGEKKRHSRKTEPGYRWNSPTTGTRSESSPEPPPKKAKSYRPKRRGKLPENSTNLLKKWLFDHWYHPYPSGKIQIN